MANPISIKIEGLETMQGHIDKAVKGSGTIYKNAMFKATAQVQKRARANLYKGHGLQTGTLRRSIFTKVAPLKGIIGVSEKYGPYVEYGTRPHIIKPRTKKALFFKSANGSIASQRGNGKISTYGVYKIVHHPGNREIPFMRPAAKDSVGDIQSIFKEAIQIVTRIAAHG